jgi:DNA-binding transcriptional LysR family regulator
VELDGIAVFVKVVQAGSFSRAARQLGLPNTTVSAKVARLEKRLGVTLIHRTTRKLHVTPAGRAYYERCAPALEAIQQAEAEMTVAAGEPAGLLRITAPGDVAHGVLPPIVTRFLESYPRVQVEIVVANRVVDLVAEGIHLAIRAAPLGDSTLMARRFLHFSGGLWASAAYLKRRGTPRSVHDLAQHDGLVFSRYSGRSPRLAFRKRLLVDDLETLRIFAERGRGIATLTDFLAREVGLVRVLPGWSWMSGALSFVYPGQRFVPANVRAFIDTALELRDSKHDCARPAARGSGGGGGNRTRVHGP